MNLASGQALATMTLEKLDEYIEQFLEYKIIALQEISEHNNPVVKHFIERKEHLLAEHVKKYVSIPTDVDANDVVRALVALQAYEKNMKEDLKSLKIPDDVEKLLDDHTELCNSMRKTKVSAKKTLR